MSSPSITAAALPEGALPTADISIGESNVLFELGIPIASGSGGSTAVWFSEAAERSNIASGETPAVLFGKIQKWFSDIKSLAFADAVESAQIADSAVTNAKLEPMADATLKGNISGGAAKPSDLSAADVGRS